MIYQWKAHSTRSTGLERVRRQILKSQMKVWIIMIYVEVKHLSQDFKLWRLTFFNPIRPAPVPQRHYHHKIVCQISMNGVTGLSFHEFSSWILLCILKKSNFQYLYKIFEKLNFEHFWSTSILSQKWRNLSESLDIELKSWLFLYVALNFFHNKYQQA